MRTVPLTRESDVTATRESDLELLRQLVEEPTATFDEVARLVGATVSADDSDEPAPTSPPPDPGPDLSGPVHPTPWKTRVSGV